MGSELNKEAEIEMSLLLLYHKKFFLQVFNKSQKSIILDV